MLPFGRHNSGSVLVLFLVMFAFVAIRFATASADARDEMRRFISPQNIRRGWSNPITAILLALFFATTIGLGLIVLAIFTESAMIGQMGFALVGYCFPPIPLYLGVIVVFSIARDVFWPSRKKKSLPDKIERNSTS